MGNDWWVLAGSDHPRLGRVIVQMQASLLIWQILAAGREARQRKQILQPKLKALRPINIKEL